MEWSTIVAAFMLGLVGAGHCIGMCGGIISGLAMGHSKTQNTVILVAGYNLGRVSSYTLIGVLGAWIVSATPSSPIPLARTVAAMVLILMGLYIANWWRVITLLEKVGAQVWNKIQPLAKRCLPIRSFAGASLVGAVWGWLPCGLVYSALAFAAASNQPLQGGAIMFAFGAGTLPALVASGTVLGWLKAKLNSRHVRPLLGLAYIAFGIWTAALAWMHAGHSGHAHSAHTPGEVTPVSSEPDHSHHHHHH